MPKLTSYKDLIVWQKSMNLVEKVYQLTPRLPKTERWGLASQICRAAVSIPSNIAEGYGRQATGDYRRLLSISRGSLLELETQLLLCLRLGHLTSEEIKSALEDIQRIGKMLNSLISKMN